ncbi:MAG TPA: S41 family peptidase [Pyrinomonadaceae bacterium]|nr:S41 family peptidase [Pyrinomonadaceae bacterium]
MSSKHFGLVVAASLVGACVLIGGVVGRPDFGGLTSGTTTEAAARVEASVNEAMSVVLDNYADDVDFEKVNQSALQGMLSTLDPHSNFFTPAEYQKLLQDQDSSFIGIGVNILRHRDGVYVQSAVEGTPAARAGLRFGDRIVEVDGRDAREWTTQQVSTAVRGPRGERVTLKIERAGAQAPLTFTVVRASVPLPSIRSSFMIRPGTGYVALTGGFTHTTAEELAEAIAALRREGMRQLVLDLRNNPGGLLDQSISVAGQFLPRGATVVSVRGRVESQQKSYKNVVSDPVDYPLVVLINRNSASASEIVAGAIQDHGRGLVVGETSFGKGLVQRLFSLPHGAGLTLTTAKYYTPYGRLIQRDYSAGSLYDYYVRHDPEDEPRPEQPGRPSQAAPPNSAVVNPTPEPTPRPTPPPGTPSVAAAGGRVFYGGGGITPDVEVKPLDVTSPARARIFEASFYFTRQLVGGLVVGLESYRVDEPQYGRYPRPTDFPVNDRVLEAFRAYARRDPESGLTPAQIDADLEYVRARLRDDIATAAYGTGAGTRTLLDTDPQLLRALEVLPEAKRLAENVGRSGTLN